MRSGALDNTEKPDLLCSALAREADCIEPAATVAGALNTESTPTGGQEISFVQTGPNVVSSGTDNRTQQLFLP